jgi:chromatin remodeling complex protein RSC6
MSTATPATKAVKRVAKKDTAAVPETVAAPAPAPVVAAEPKAKATKKAAAVAAPAPVVVSSTPVEAAPAAATAPTTTLDEDIKSVMTSLSTLRETVASMMSQVKKLEKRVHREIKDARKRKRRAPATTENGEPVKRAPSIFERPVQVTDELCAFLGKPKGTLMSRSEVTKGVNNYVKEKNLKNKHDIKADAPLRKLLAITEAEHLTYFNLQRFLNRHYVKAAVKA